VAALFVAALIKRLQHLRHEFTGAFEHVVHRRPVEIAIAAQSVCFSISNTSNIKTQNRRQAAYSWA